MVKYLQISLVAVALVASIFGQAIPGKVGGPPAQLPSQANAGLPAPANPKQTVESTTTTDGSPTAKGKGVGQGQGGESGGHKKKRRKKQPEA